MQNDDPKSKIIRFPFARSGVAMSRDAPRNLGLTPMSKAVATEGRGAKGHWCADCKGIWYSYFPEVQCPVCGRRG
ncbi:hypothetical protein RA2_01908 [Roseovarius sp. A-2]|uniref:hypothetical protein n=1 Tax=Roseovarius sp. A-2 TaxID=1570360 RepID=UPI0009B50FC9|nr:hypothetical protein [Roseovarius sp. A-2]GAW34855.1 hypothetical protein RA2_01908 [Roseovarius sp. A-2]